MHRIELTVGSEKRRAPIRQRRRCRTLLRRMLRPLEGVDCTHSADLLISHFGSLRATLSAKPDELFRAVGDQRVVSHLRVIRQSMRWALRTEVEERTFLNSTDALREYLRFSHGGDALEQLRVFYMYAAGKLIREQCFDHGAPDQTVASVSQVIGRGLDVGARYMIMAHNHPSGDPRPSAGDYEVTRKIAVGAHHVGITLFDHLIVAEGCDFSFRENGRL